LKPYEVEQKFVIKNQENDFILGNLPMKLEMSKVYYKADINIYTVSGILKSGHGSNLLFRGFFKR
jgi:hypothetical protein